MFVLKSRKYPMCNNYYAWDGYYTGKNYILLGENYAVVDERLEKAKKYTSRKRAENACDKLNEKVINYQFDVVDKEEEK